MCAHVSCWCCAQAADAVHITTWPSTSLESLKATIAEVRVSAWFSVRFARSHVVDGKSFGCCCAFVCGCVCALWVLLRAQKLKLPPWWSFTVLKADGETAIANDAHGHARPEIGDSEAVIVRVDGIGPYTSRASWVRIAAEADPGQTTPTAYVAADEAHEDAVGTSFTVADVVGGEGVVLPPWKQVRDVVLCVCWYVLS